MKRHENESLNPGYQKEHFESQQAILASFYNILEFFKVVISGRTAPVTAWGGGQGANGERMRAGVF